MIDVRIICTHDALSFAEMLMRLLSAEEHNVRLLFGRQSVAELEAARSARDAVIVIWSYDAPSQHYMLEWARTINAARLIEITRAQGAPRWERRTPALDFTGWRGERGARVWKELNERLRGVERALNPPKTPVREAVALGLASAVAVGGAMLVRTQQEETPAAPIAAAEHQAAAAVVIETGMGGPTEMIEPASAEDLLIDFRPLRNRLGALAPRTERALAEPTEVSELELRDPTLWERLFGLAPTRGEEG